MRRILYSLILFFLISNLNVFAQPPSQTQALLPKVISATPEAAGIAKFGNYPVNMYTGVPDISIPLYTIQVGELKVPISLNYHASGIRVSEIASWSGLGWSLSAGGTINRKMMSKPDEQDAGYLSGPTVKISTEIDPAVFSGLDYLRDINLGYSDVEPDIFSYNVPGKSGKFIFNQRDNFNIITMPYDPVKVNRTHPNQSIMLLSVTDESGIQYKFDTYEWTNTSTASSQTNAISTWMLSHMISSNKQDTISFSYTPRTGSGNTDHSFSETVVVNDEVANFTNPAPYSSDFGNAYTSDTWISTTWQLNNEIIFKNGKIVFEQSTDTRQDFAQWGTVMPNRLNAIKIYSYDKMANSYMLIRTIQFYHSYFISGTDATTKRLRLDSISIKSMGGTEVEKYRFEYNTSQLLPSRLSMAKDYWGYFNNKNNNMLMPRMQINHTPTSTSSTTTIWIGSNILDGREPDPNYMQANILTKIFFPTGGRTEFEYETNKYIDAQSVVKNAGGLRIKKIKSYDGVNINPVVKTYKYGLNESGYGRANFFLTNYFFQNSQINQYWYFPGQPSCWQVGATKRVRTFFSNPTIDIEPFDGSPVGYATVTEYIGDETTNTGKTIYQFNDQGDGMNVVAAYGRPIITSYHFNRGQVITKTVYKKNGSGQFKKITATANQYEAFPQVFHPYLGIVVFKKKISQGANGDNIPLGPVSEGTCPGYNDTENYQFANYSVRTGDNRLIETVESLFDENDETKSVSTTTKFFYDNINHMQVTRIETYNSEGETILNTLKYPHDYAAAPYTSMVIANIINKVVEDKQTNNGIQTTLKKNNYFDWSNFNYLPQTLQLQVSSNTIETRANFLKYDTRGNVQEMQKTNDVKLSYVWDYQKMYAVAEVNNASESDIAYTSFESDGKGNWTFTGLPAPDPSAPTGKKCYTLGANITKSGLSTLTTYIVSYWKKSGTVAVNATTPLIGRSVNGWTYYEHKVINPVGGLITVSGTSGIIDELRLYPAAAQMTTYTYEPLIGVTHQCDANNRISYYEYDEIQRLMLIRDQDKNILRQFCYNYFGQPENCNIFYNTQRFGTYTKVCAAGFIGNSVTYTVPTGTYSASTQAAADQRAQDDVNANGQNYANTNGTCTAGITINGYNSKNQNYNLRFTKSTGEVFNFVLTANTFTPQYIGTVLSGSYTVLFYPQASAVTATFSINGLTYFGTGASFSNVSITSTSTASMY